MTGLIRNWETGKLVKFFNKRLGWGSVGQLLLSYPHMIIKCIKE